MAVDRGSLRPRVLLALQDDPSFGEPTVYCCNAEKLQRVAGGPVDHAGYRCEAAGAAFFRLYDFQEGEQQGKDGASESDDEESVNGEEYGKGKKSPKAQAAGGMLKLSDALKKVNLYELLGCAEAASQEEMKKAYRQLVLTAHPDKLDAGVDEATYKAAQERFVMIQEAYELLSDPAKRMQYDSSLDFDDSLPRFKADQGDDFFEVFGECFRRNARWSTKRPVPDIGNADTKPEEWKRFYNFWYVFSTWRDPIILAQKEGEELCDLADAECREEKRWMMRENERIAKRYRQAERDRISELVRLAEKYDPRIAAEKEAKKAARQAEAARRHEEQMAIQRKKEEEERIRREAEEAEKAAQAEIRAKEKAAREAIKEKVKKLRQRLRGFHSQVAEFVLLDQLNEVCLQFEEAKLRKLGDDVEKALKKSAETAASLIHEAIESVGLKAVTSVKAEDDNQSTTSGQSESAEELDPEERERRAEAERLAAIAREERAKQRAEEAAKAAEEKAKREAEKAEEKKRRDEQRRKEQAAAEAKKRQQEKKEEEKAKKKQQQQEARAEKDEEKKKQQQEEAKAKAAEQAEKDKQEALKRKAEMDSERVAQMFAADRLERLTKLDAASEEVLTEELSAALESNVSVRSALHALKADNAEKEALIDRAMALVHKVGPIWPLGLLPPAEIKLPPAVRNRVKKARQRLRDVMGTFVAKTPFDGADPATVTEWQQSILDGSAELPVWTPEEREEEEKAAKEAAAAAATSKKKKAKEPKAADEDLDKILAELGDASSPSSKKSGKKKK